MNITNYNYGIKFSDLVDINNPYTTYEMIEEKINEVLTINCKRNYFIDDEALWNDFIKRFSARYVFRTLSFDTYMNFFIKLNQVFLDNKLILKRMYETKMIEFNPLYSIYKENENTSDSNEKTETEKTENEKNSRNTSGNSMTDKNGSDTDTHSGDDTVKHNGDDTTTHSGENSNMKTGDDTTTHSGNDTHYKLHSDSPRSTVEVSDLFENENNYITDAENTKDIYNSSNKIDYNSTSTDNYSSQNKVQYNSNDKNEYNSSIEHNYGSNLTTEYSDEMKNEKDNEIKIGENKDTTSKSNGLLKGYENSPVDNLEKYLEFVIDCNEYLLSQIDKNHLFMDIII